MVSVRLSVGKLFRGLSFSHLDDKQLVDRNIITMHFSVFDNLAAKSMASGYTRLIIRSDASNALVIWLSPVNK